MLTMSSIHASYSIPILSPFLFMPSLYALLFVIHRIFDLLVSTHFYTQLSYTHVYKVSCLCATVSSLTGEEGKLQ